MILVGAVLFEFTVTVCDAHEVVLQVPEYLTKYVVVDVGDTVMEFPVPTGVPPHDPENHCAVAPVPEVPPDKVNVVDAPEQIVEVPVMLVGATLGMFMVTLVLATADVQPATTT